MSEPVLKSIIQLLAISATIDGEIRESERRVIYEFIYDNLNEDQAKSYINLFNDYAEIALAGNIEAVNICNRINYELNQKQKIVVLFHLLELISVDGSVHELDSVFVDQVAEAFKIDTHEYNVIKAFVTDEEALKLGLNNILVISNQKFSEGVKHIYKPGFNSVIGILRIPTVEMYMVKYYVGDNSNTFLNGLPLKDRHIYSFPNGSSIRNEQLIIPIYYSDVVGCFLEEDNTAWISFEAKHVYYTFAGGKIGLRDINIAEESGKLVGIMGASGSGKSTLLNVLNGNEIPIGGKVSINQIDIHNEDEKRKIKGVIGYVPQDDLLIEELSVFQNMYYATKLCFGNYGEVEIKNLVLKTLQSLGLAEISHLKVGNSLQKTISGGQRKRLNIGLELLREPSVLFIDEPTSGLSSSDSENIMDLLKELTLKGKLIFVVIHQPSSAIYKMFDKMIILDTGGYQIFYGNPIEAIIYFKRKVNLVDSEEGICFNCGNVDHEQIFNIIETKVIDEYGRYTKERKILPAQWRKYYEEELPNLKIEINSEVPETTLKIPSRFKQWLIFCKRDIRAKLSNSQYMAISLLEAPLLAFILAYIVRYYHVEPSVGHYKYIFAENVNLPAYIFMSIIVSLFIGLTVSAEEIIKDLKILKREAFLHLSRMSYLLSKIAILFTFSAIQTLSFVLIGNWILEIEGMHFNYWIVLFSTACFANVLGLNISSAFNSVITIYILIPILLIPQLILGGIVVKFDDMNPALTSANKVPFVSEIMVSRWALEAMVVSQFKHNQFERQFFEFDKKMANADYKKIYYIPKLESIEAYCSTNLNTTNDSIRQTVEKKIKLLAYEIKKESAISKEVFFSRKNELTLDKFNAETAQALKNYFDKLKTHYVRLYNRVDKAKNKYISKLTNDSFKREEFVRNAQKHHNKTIETLVTGKDEAVRVVETNHQIIQKIYPIFQDSYTEDNIWFGLRTHFLASQKNLFGYSMGTLSFNVMVIWSMTLVFYFLLYFKIFRESFKVIAIVFSKKAKRRN